MPWARLRLIPPLHPRFGRGFGWAHQGRGRMNAPPRSPSSAVASAAVAPRVRPPAPPTPSSAPSPSDLMLPGTLVAGATYRSPLPVALLVLPAPVVAATGAATSLFAAAPRRGCRRGAGSGGRPAAPTSTDGTELGDGALLEAAHEAAHLGIRCGGVVAGWQAGQRRGPSVCGRHLSRGGQEDQPHVAHGGQALNRELGWGFAACPSPPPTPPSHPPPSGRVEHVAKKKGKRHQF